MSSKEAEFITQWNGLLDYKIDEHNLRRPNFQFFHLALESLLRSLNFNIEATKDEARAVAISNNADPERTYYIMFCGYVHRLYQLSDKSFNFYYFDLTNPTPKKSFHVLKMLFNYLKYYEMVKKNIYEKANEALTAYNEALTTNNSLQVKNETAKNRAAKMEQQLDEYKTKLPAIRERVDKCLADVQSLDKEIVQKNAEIKKFDSTIMKTEIRHTELSEAVVSEDDYNERVDKIAELNRELNELREVAEHVRSSNVGSSAKINELTRTLDIVTKELEEQKLSHYEELITLNTNVNLARQEILLEQQRINELKANIKELITNTNDILTKTKQMEFSTDKIQSDSNAKSDELTRVKLGYDREIEQASNELFELKARIKELEDQREFICTQIVTLLRTITSSKPNTEKGL